MTMYPYNAHNMTMVIPVSKFADLHVKIKSMEQENARLKAENARLIKATDAMADAIDIYRRWRRLPGDEPFRDALNLVIDAMKEGKQP
jgi:hypothetical protein